MTSIPLQIRLAVSVALIATGVGVLADAGVATSAGESARCFGRTATIIEPDSRSITGSDEGDVIVAGNGVNLVEGKGGADFICAGDGKDVIRGGPGDDQINGQGADDLLFGAGGDDDIYGKGGDDIMDGKGGHDLCVGGSGADLAAARRCDRIRGADPSEA